MKYYEVLVRTSKAGIEMIDVILQQLDITGAVVTDPDDAQEILNNKEKYKWDYADEEALMPSINTPVITVYFSNDQDGKVKMKEFREKLIELQKQVSRGEFGPEAGLGPLQIETKIVSDETWKDTWKEHFKPVHVTENIVIKPTWEDYKVESDEKELKLIQVWHLAQGIMQQPEDV